MLHILMNSPFKINFNLILKMLNAQDDFIAVQDGVFISIKKGLFLNRILQSSVKLYVLREDLVSRGIFVKVFHAFKIINYSEFIILTEKHKQYINW